VQKGGILILIKRGGNLINWIWQIIEEHFTNHENMSKIYGNITNFDEFKSARKISIEELEEMIRKISIDTINEHHAQVKHK